MARRGHRWSQTGTAVRDGHPGLALEPSSSKDPGPLFMQACAMASMLQKVTFREDMQDEVEVFEKSDTVQIVQRALTGVLTENPGNDELQSEVLRLFTAVGRKTPCAKALVSGRPGMLVLYDLNRNSSSRRGVRSPPWGTIGIGPSDCESIYGI